MDEPRTVISSPFFSSPLKKMLPVCSVMYAFVGNAWVTGTISSGKTSLVSSNSEAKAMPLNKIRVVRKKEIMVGVGCANAGSS